MAVDRGGLQYTISVRDQFSRNTSRFRQEMAQSKAAFRDFQRELRNTRGTRGLQRQNQLTREQLATLRQLDQQARAQRTRERESVRIRNAQQRDAVRAARARQQAEAQAARQAQQAQIAEQRRLQALARAQRERERIAQRIAAQQRRDAAAQARRDPRLAAQRQVNQELFREAVLRERISLLQARGRAQIAGGDIVAGAATLRRARELRQNIEGTRNAAGQLLFTFRRLVGVLAIFTLARQGVATFNQLVGAGVRFNDTVENATLGIGGLIATLGDVRNEFGQSVGQVEELDLALGEARRQVFLLRQDSLRTVATFEQLLDTFQVAVGPGLAAGLNLDEIRTLTVQISQAAAALSVPQNQLAEEIRSLLSGTIQARTTRIATALGITNADIRRLRETGELADFLEDRLEGFSVAAQRAARQTLSGIRALVQGALGEVLGQAARPLFDELLEAGNELLDEVLTITDAAGNIRPNPEAVAAFRQLFDALRQGLESLREFGADLGFDGLQNVIGAISTGLVAAIEFAIGAARTLFATFQLFARPIRALADALGLSNQQLGSLAALAGELTIALVLANKTLGLFGANLGTVVQTAIRLGRSLRSIPPTLALAVGKGAVFVTAIAAVAKGFEFILEKIFDVDLSLRDTIFLISNGLVAAWVEVISTIKVASIAVARVLISAVDKIISNIKEKSLRARAFVASGVGADEEAQELVTRADEEEVARLARESALRKKAEEEIAAIRVNAAADLLEIENKIAERIGEAAERGARGEGFDPDFDPEAAAEEAARAAQAAADAVGEFNGNISTVDKSIAALSSELVKLEDAFRSAQIEFGVGPTSIEGLGGQIDSAFREQEIASAERLLQINNDLEQVRERINAGLEKGVVSQERLQQIEAALQSDIQQREAAIEALNLTAEEGEIVSLLRDQIDLRDGIANAERLGLQLAAQKAAIIAQTELPALREEAALRQAEASALRAQVTAEQANAGQRQLAIVAAQNELNIFRQQATIQRAKLNAEITVTRARIETAQAGSEEQAALQAGLEILLTRRAIEEEILVLRNMQLERAREEAQLRATGSFSEGVTAGLELLRDELPTIFEVGLNLTRQVVTSFASFAATEIVNAIVNAEQEGVDRTELFRRAAGQFAQQLATQILEQVIQNLIQTLLANALGEATIEQGSATIAANTRVQGAILAGEIEKAAAVQAAAIRASAGFHDGGLVGFNAGGFVADMSAHLSRAARGFAGGGFARPPHIHPADTVPAWLTPGEFVMSRAAVRAIGVDTLAAMNRGNFGVVGSASAEAAGPSTGMQAGGLVSNQLQQSAADNAAARAAGEEAAPPIGVVVARDREMDQLTAGGRNALLQFMRENGSTIRSLIDRGQGRRG